MDLFTLQRRIIRLEQDVKRLRAITDAQTAQITNLFSLLAAFGAQSERAGADLAPLATGVSTTDVTWPMPFPDTAYGVIPTIVVPGANMGQCFVELSSKTTTGATIAIRNTSGGTLATALLDVLAIRT